MLSTEATTDNVKKSIMASDESEIRARLQEAREPTNTLAPKLR